MNTMKCKQVSRLLSSYADGELAGQAQVAVMAHLEVCPACRRQFEMEAADRQALANLQVPELSPFIATRVMAEVRALGQGRQRGLVGFGRVFSGLAAAVLIVASIGVGALVGVQFAEPAAVETGIAEQLLTGSEQDPLLELSVDEGQGS